MSNINNEKLIESDQQARIDALNPSQSFIVQAPAGSGKTELLSQRYLKLLSQAAQPESILAITFTRKAAAEMHERIMHALLEAHQQKPVLSPHLQQRRDLALAVLKQDKKQDWSLLSNPKRLSIMTIDALAASLNQRMPLLSRAGGSARISESPQALYQEAIARLFNECHDNSPISESLRALLLHVDNRSELLSQLLMQLLGKREQWLSHVLYEEDDWSMLRTHVEKSFALIRKETLDQLQSSMPASVKSSVWEALSYCQDHIDDKDHPLCQFDDSESFDSWLAASHLLLSKTGQWRKRWNKTLGFPAKTEGSKQQQEQLSECRLTLCDCDELQQQLIDLQSLPPSAYQNEQWCYLSHLLRLLPRLAAHCRMVFAEKGELDFIELNLNALHALGEDEQPTDMALYLDVQIQHLLIDEFQDTSSMQFDLIRKLTRGWSPHDGRTLFLVGDPQQSIYRFRSAEVGLFLQVKHHGLGDISMQYLLLRRNFRSESGLVNGFNHMFQAIFPKQENPNTGAVAYQESLASNDHAKGSIARHQLNDDYHYQDVLKNIILPIQQKEPSASIAILIRARSHLASITQGLNAAGIGYQSYELESLADNKHIQDLITLTLSLLQPNQRYRWLCLLRTPWIGLSCQDLYFFGQLSFKQSIPSLINQHHQIPLTDQGQAQLERVAPIIKHVLEHHGRQSLADWIKGCWIALGGCHTITQTEKDPARSLDACEQYFQLLTSLLADNIIIDEQTLQDKLAQTPLKSSDHADQQVTIMTIHKSKGLEFDHVILPHLEKRSAQDGQALFLWEERIIHQNKHLLLAPLRPSDGSNDPFYQYLQRCNQQRSRHEHCRLFYVAATRAKQSLHLCYVDNKASQKPGSTKSSSLLSLIERCDHWCEAPAQYATPTEKATLQTPSEKSYNAPYSRVDPRWILLLNQAPLNWTEKLETGKQSYIQLHSEDPEPRAFGQLMHEIMALLGMRSLDYLHVIESYSDQHWMQLFEQMGIGHTSHTYYLKRLHQSLSTISRDQRAQWILSQAHHDVHNEYSLIEKQQNTNKTHIIDRCFIDDENKQWIIDYKFSQPDDDEPMPLFLRKKHVEYQAQLERYANIMKALSDRPIHCGLYFPLCGAWIEWPAKIKQARKHRTAEA